MTICLYVCMYVCMYNNNNCRTSTAPISLKRSGTGIGYHWSMEPPNIYGGKAIK